MAVETQSCIKKSYRDVKLYCDLYNVIKRGEVLQ